jgi:hypothetical protein
MKKFFWGKKHKVLFYNNHVGSLYVVGTHNVNGGCILEDCGRGGLGSHNGNGRCTLEGSNTRGLR